MSSFLHNKLDKMFSFFLLNIPFFGIKCFTKLKRISGNFCGL